MKEFKIDLSMYKGKVREMVSEAIQRHAFELGYEGWSVGGKKLKHSDEPYLFIHPSRIGMTTYGGGDYFRNDKSALISAADFLALTQEDVKDAPQEPEFKPFDRVIGGVGYHQCIPYEGNEHLLGTTGEPK